MVAVVSDGSEICSRKKNLQELYKDSVFVEVDDVVMLSGKTHHSCGKCRRNSYE